MISYFIGYYLIVDGHVVTVSFSPEPNPAEADIPMQRRECHRFAEEHGWIIIHEEQEDGVSGHKVRAENRDKLQIIKEHARQGKFDILRVPGLPVAHRLGH